MTPPNEERAWAAGFFDGEGCFSLNRNRAVATISQVDREVLDRFCRIAQCGRVYGPQGGGANPNRQAFYVWRISARADFDGLIELLWPWLGTVKRDAALRVDESAGPGGNAQSRKTHCAQGHPYDETNTLWVKGKHGRRTYRQCHACHRDRDAARKVA